LYPALTALLVLLAAPAAEAQTGPAPSRLRVSISPTVRVGTPTNITVFVLDTSGFIARSYAGKIDFTIENASSDVATLPASYIFTAEDRGQHTFIGGLVANREASFHVRATDSLDTTITGITEITAVGELAPLILGDANPRAVAGQPWQYNSSGSVTVNGVPPLTFSTCGSVPLGFQIDAATGRVSWTPSGANAQEFVCIRVDNIFGFAQYEFDVSVGSPGEMSVPTVSLTAQPTIARAGEDVLLDASANGVDPAAAPLLFSWRSGDGPIALLRLEYLAVHRYLVPGGWNAEVRVRDAFGKEATDRASVQITDAQGRLPPVARILALAQQTAPGTFTFSCDCSSDLGPLTYRWDFGDGQRSNDSAPTVTYAPGRYHPTLIVVASNGLFAWDSIEVVVDGEGSVPPTCVGWAQPVAAGPAPLSTHLGALYSAGTAAISNVQWEIDGQVLARSDVAYTFSAGFHEAKLRVDAADGQVCTATLPIFSQASPGTVPAMIVSEPPGASRCGLKWAYQPIAMGTGPFTWKLTNAPEGMSLNDATGELSWMPDPRLGPTTFTITATDSDGDYDQAVTLEVPCREVTLQTCGCGAADGFPAFAGAALLWLTLRPRRRAQRDRPPRS
jgi:PKD repeat protein